MPKFLISQLVTHLNRSDNKTVMEVRQEMARSLDSLCPRTYAPTRKVYCYSALYFRCYIMDIYHFRSPYKSYFLNVREHESCLPRELSALFLNHTVVVSGSKRAFRKLLILVKNTISNIPKNRTYPSKKSYRVL